MAKELAWVAVDIEVSGPDPLRNGILAIGMCAWSKSTGLVKKRFDAKLIHTHTFPLEEVPEALRHARERIDDAIKVVVKISHPEGC